MKSKIKILIILVLTSFVVIMINLIFLINPTGYVIKDFKPVSLQKVIIKLKWIHQSQFAGDYVALEKGFYKKEGLDVKIDQYDFKNSPISIVSGYEYSPAITGKVINNEESNKPILFGIAGADEILLARSKGIPVKAIAVIYKISPVCAYTLKESNITTPFEFVNKTVGLERGTNVDISYYLMMKKLGINRSNINEVSVGYDATELLNGTTDISTGYSINEPEQVVEKGHDVNTILFADYGVNIYSDVLFTTDETIKNHLDIVNRFVNATLEGWQYAIENENESVNITLRFAKDRTFNHERFMLDKSIPLIYDGQTPIGYMDKIKWNNLEQTMIDEGVIDNKIYINDCYTNEFVDKIYKK